MKSFVSFHHKRETQDMFLISLEFWNNTKTSCWRDATILTSDTAVRRWEDEASFSFPPVQQTLVGKRLLIIEASRSHSDTPHSVRLIWTSGQTVAETSTRQHTTHTKDRYSCPQRVSNPQSHQASGRRPMLYTPRPLGPAGRSLI
jgi:hypothetical protein